MTLVKSFLDRAQHPPAEGEGKPKGLFCAMCLSGTPRTTSDWLEIFRKEYLTTPSQHFFLVVFFLQFPRHSVAKSAFLLMIISAIITCNILQPRKGVLDPRRIRFEMSKHSVSGKAFIQSAGFLKSRMPRPDRIVTHIFKEQKLSKYLLHVSVFDETFTLKSDKNLCIWYHICCCNTSYRFKYQFSIHFPTWRLGISKTSASLGEVQYLVCHLGRCQKKNYDLNFLLKSCERYNDCNLEMPIWIPKKTWIPSRIDVFGSPAMTIDPYVPTAGWAAFHHSHLICIATW